MNIIKKILESRIDRNWEKSGYNLGQNPPRKVNNSLPTRKPSSPETYFVEIDGKKWKTFSTREQAINVANSLKKKGKNASAMIQIN